MGCMFRLVVREGVDEASILIDSVKNFLFSVCVRVVVESA
jgi:hypothetical protein